MSLDCKTIYSCDGPLQAPSVSTLLPCSGNGFCIVDNNIPKCQCKDGYIGDGYSCTLSNTDKIKFNLNKKIII